jgi:hypothetical protein
MHKSGFTFLVQDCRYSDDGLLVSKVRPSRDEIWGQNAQVGVLLLTRLAQDCLYSADDLLVSKVKLSSREEIWGQHDKSGFTY